MTEGTWIDEAKKNAGLLIFLGVLTVIFGVLAIGAPFVTGLAVTIYVGCLLVLAGIMRIVHAFKSEQWGTGFWGTIIGLLTILAGLVTIIRPGVGLATLTLLLAIYFLVEGISEIIAAFRIRPDQGWGWVLFNGAVAVLLGFFIWLQWPVSGAWAIGVLVGVHILLSGWSMIILGTGARRFAGAVEDTVEGIVDTAEDLAEKAGAVAATAVDKAEDLAEDAVEKAKDIAEDVADTAEEAVEKAKDMAENAVEKAKDLVDDDEGGKTKE